MARIEPQWSPVTKTGKTRTAGQAGHLSDELPQWSPVTKTGKTCPGQCNDTWVVAAAMEPGHEDREDLIAHIMIALAQWAAMEPGHEDREDEPQVVPTVRTNRAAMEPGHEDREDLWPAADSARR